VQVPQPQGRLVRRKGRQGRGSFLRAPGRRLPRPAPGGGRSLLDFLQLRPRLRLGRRFRRPFR
jgi:hypothetical protein